jgi:hypothetical protein
MSLDTNTEPLAAELKFGTPARIIQVIAEHRAIAAEAARRIDTEGTVVRTLKGDVIPHPALRVHAEATKAETALLKDYAARATARL